MSIRFTPEQVEKMNDLRLEAAFSFDMSQLKSLCTLRDKINHELCHSAYGVNEEDALAKALEKTSDDDRVMTRGEMERRIKDLEEASAKGEPAPKKRGRPKKEKPDRPPGSANVVGSMRNSDEL